MDEHERGIMRTNNTRLEEGSIFRIGSVAGIVGSLLAMVGNLLHPATPSGDPEGVAQTVAQSESWVLVHLVIVVGLILMLGGLVAISRSIEGGLPGALARLGSVAAVAGVTVGVILVIVDGVAAKHLADAWEAAPPDQAAVALGVVLAEEAINFALASLFNILFAGVTFILLGLAVAWSKEYPRWLGWVVVVAGVGSVPVGLVQAYTGESIGFIRIATIIFPTIITLWVVGMSVLILRKALSKGGRMS
jgi:FtsH-binding integral membrane protein